VPAAAAPARMKDEELPHLPPIHLDVYLLDLFRNETIELGSRALKSGVSEELHVYPACTQGFELFAPRAGVSQQAAASHV
jgi:acetyl esterase/lipase